MNTQNELFSELVKLKSENPDLDVIFMVDGGEVLFDNERTAHRIEYVDIDYFFKNDADGYCIGEPSIVDYIEENTGVGLIDIACAKREMPGRIKKAIIVYTGAL